MAAVTPKNSAAVPVRVTPGLSSIVTHAKMKAELPHTIGSSSSTWPTRQSVAWKRTEPAPTAMNAKNENQNRGSRPYTVRWWRQMP